MELAAHSKTSGMKNVIVGTAGHIDHGKTTLVRALTGIDTDRLEEEKRRGISIELGFAHLMLSDDLRIGLVDVPGHERFVRNMLAGASGIDLALLVVAATESIKPQTREHFDICRLLGIPAGLVAITKTDLVDAEMVELVKLEVEELTAGSFLEGAPVIPVSAATGAGLDVLKAELRQAALGVTAKNARSWFRLPVDRAFTMKGFGAVVTGTLTAGQVALEDEVEIHPEGLIARVRGLQVHGAAAKKAMAGQRTAVNLAGVELEQLRRGQVLAAKGRLRAADRFDVRLTLLSSASPLKARSPVHLHAGTAEIEATVSPLGSATRIEPGSEIYARVTLAEPALLLPGDRFIIRRFSPVITIGGGVIVDVAPPRKSTPPRLARLESDRVGTLLAESRYGLSVADLIARTGLEADSCTRGRVVLREPQPWVVDGSTLERETERLGAALAQFHREHPLLPAMPKESLRGSLPAFLFEHLLAANAAAWVAEGEGVRLKTHKVVMQIDESAALEKIERLFADAGLAVPSTNEVLAQSGVDQNRAKTLLQTLLRERKLVRINLELVFHSTALGKLRELLAAKKGSRFSVAEFKDWTGVSRKYAIPLLEFLDRERVTRREGDARIVN